MSQVLTLPPATGFVGQWPLAGRTPLEGRSPDVRIPKVVLPVAWILILAACEAEPEMEEMPAPEATQPAPATATIAPADVAGTWSMRGLNEAGDSIVGFQLVATATTEGWTLVFPGRDPVPMRVVAVEGDSIVTEAGPYESAIREGVPVRTEGSFRLQGGSLVGTTVARYETSEADSVVRIRTEGTRQQ